MAEQVQDYIAAPEEIDDILQETAFKKANLPVWKTFLLAILAGIFIAFGGMYCTVAASDALKVLPYGITRLLAGGVFCLGLILVVIAGAELFTGNTMLSILDLRKPENVVKLLKNWGIVYIGNFVGSILIALLIFFSGNYLSGNGIVGKTALSTAVTKVSHTFMEAMLLGILCNMLVCLAIWMAMRTRTVIGKIFCIIFPISAFVAAGFEHSVANMYLIPVALFIKTNAAFVATTGAKVATLTWESFLFNNLIPVTIGNIIGGVVIWLTYHLVYRKNN